MSQLEGVDHAVNEGGDLKAIPDMRCNQVITKNWGICTKVYDHISEMVVDSTDVFICLSLSACDGVVHTAIPSVIDDFMLLSFFNRVDGHQINIPNHSHRKPILKANAFADYPLIVGQGIFSDRTHLTTNSYHQQRPIRGVYDGDINIFRLVRSEDRGLENGSHPPFRCTFSEAAL